MINEIKNKITVYGTPDELNDFDKFVKNDQGLFDLSRIVNVPPDILENVGNLQGALEFYISEHQGIEATKWDLSSKMVKAYLSLFFFPYPTSKLSAAQLRLTGNYIQIPKIKGQRTQETPYGLHGKTFCKPIPRLWSPKTLADFYDLGEIAVSTYEKYGYVDYIGWTMAYWGSRGNCYDSEFSSNETFFTYTFSTDMNMPIEIMKCLFVKFSELKIVWECSSLNDTAQNVTWIKEYGLTYGFRS